MSKLIRHHIAKHAHIPSPLAGLALAIASLGWAWELLFPQLDGLAQITGATLALFLIAPVTIKFSFHIHILLQELKHPVLGSVIPTYSMTLLMFSKTIEQFNHWLGVILWLFSIVLHLLFLSLFIFYRSRDICIEQLIPSWFIPPIGIIVAAVTFPGEFPLLAKILLYFGMTTYFVMLPIMLYRLIFHKAIPEAVRPTIAVLAAPASLSLVGYLTLTPLPSIILISLLLGTALLMTLLIYMSLFHFRKLEFSPSFSSLTFPLVISATALLKATDWLAKQGIHPMEKSIFLLVGIVELVIATLVVTIVLFKYIQQHMYFK